MPTGKADPFGPQGEVLGQTFTVRVDNTKIGFPGSNKVSRTHSTSSERQATAASGASVQSSWSGSDYEDARSAYLRGSLLMRDGDYRGARILLTQAGQTFHKIGLEREEGSAVAQLKELEMAVAREGRGHEVDGMGMGNQEEALFRHLSREMSQGIERERTRGEIEARHKAIADALPVVHEDTQAERLDKARAGRRAKAPEPTKEQKEAMRKMQEEAAKEEARIEAGKFAREKKDHADELLDKGEAEAARGLFLEAGQMWASAGMTDEASEAKRGIEAASNILRSVADSNAGKAHALMERPGDPQMESLELAEHMLARAGELYEVVGELDESRRTRGRAQALALARKGTGFLGKGREFAAEGRLGDAMGDLWMAEAMLEKAIAGETSYWIGPS